MQSIKYHEYFTLLILDTYFTIVTYFFLKID